MQGGVLENQPNAGRTSLGIAADGTLQAAVVSFYGTWQASAGQRKLTLNSRDGHFTLFTPAYGALDPAGDGRRRRSGLLLVPAGAGGQGPHRHRRADHVRRRHADPAGRRRPRRARHRLRGAARERGAGRPAGHRPSHADAGLERPRERDRRRPAARARTARRSSRTARRSAPGFLQSRSARGAIGQLADGRIVLVTVEAATPTYSVGLSSYALALELVKLGAVTAVGLGSGPQAGMAFDGSLLTRPTTGTEQGIADALVLSYTGVYAPPVAPVLSPNGDGVGDTETLSYRLVRPATVTATLNGPNGATVPLETGRRAGGSPHVRRGTGRSRACRSRKARGRSPSRRPTTARSRRRRSGRSRSTTRSARSPSPPTRRG